ncbi:MAG TPA: aminotransferase class V-fold PLP-dependent enzyme [Chloroflexota bacterium]|nr:aminotransferase class V-fold PLP-dependent enzyme [Chloroflexota bacterium]
MYVDHAATTPVRAGVLAAMLPYFSEQWGNPSSLYGPGRRAAQAVAAARQTVAEIFGCTREEVVFTGSGSEGANLAIKGVAMAAAQMGKRHLVTSRVEHHAVLDTCRWLAANAGFSLTEIDVDAEGHVDLAALEQAITPQTALVSIMYANNEVGTIQPIQDVVRIAHGHGVAVHTDAVQAAGHLLLDVEALGVDLLSIAAHKFYGPKGVGALYVRRGTRLVPQTQGGGQERNRRSGTENVAGLVGLATALELAQDERSSVAPRLTALSAELLTKLPAQVSGCRVTGPTDPAQRLPGHASFVFEGIEIAPVLLGLDRHDIWASSGSACTSASSEPSHVLVAMGVGREWVFGALRLTVGADNSAADIGVLLEAIPPLVVGVRPKLMAVV